MKTKKRNYIFLAVLMMGIATMMTACADNDLASQTPNGGGTNPTDMNVDEMNVKVTADMPTAVLSSFDENSMGAALVRRLSNTTTSVNDNTKMILIKGEDIKSRPITEWFQAAKIYLQGGYIAVEKPRNAHMVEVAEQLSTKLEQATVELMTPPALPISSRWQLPAVAQTMKQSLLPRWSSSHPGGTTSASLTRVSWSAPHTQTRMETRL